MPFHTSQAAQCIAEVFGVSNERDADVGHSASPILSIGSREIGAWILRDETQVRAYSLGPAASLPTVFEAGVAALRATQKAGATCAATREELAAVPLFVRFVEAARGKGYFDGCEEGTAAYERRYLKIVERFRAGAPASQSPTKTTVKAAATRETESEPVNTALLSHAAGAVPPAAAPAAREQESRLVAAPASSDEAGEEASAQAGHVPHSRDEAQRLAKAAKREGDDASKRRVQVASVWFLRRIPNWPFHRTHIERPHRTRDDDDDDDDVAPRSREMPFFSSSKTTLRAAVSFGGSGATSPARSSATARRSHSALRAATRAPAYILTFGYVCAFKDSRLRPKRRRVLNLLNPRTHFRIVSRVGARGVRESRRGALPRGRADGGRRQRPTTVVI